jgi:DNA modification methylase
MNRGISVGNKLWKQEGNAGLKSLGGTGLSSPRVNIKYHYRGKFSGKEEKAETVGVNTMYRNYDPDDKYNMFKLWLKEQIVSSNIVKQLEKMFGRWVVAGWFRIDRSVTTLPNIEQWEVIKEMLGISGEIEFDELVSKTAYKRVPDTFVINPEGSPDQHFAVAPFELIKLLMLHGCPEKGVVLDPFGGSGRMGEIAHKFGRSGILIEPSNEYCAIIQKSLRNEIIERNLFEDVKLK